MVDFPEDGMPVIQTAKPFFLATKIHTQREIIKNVMGVGILIFYFFKAYEGFVFIGEVFGRY